MNPLVLIALIVGLVLWAKVRAATRLTYEVGFPALSSIGIEGGFLRFDLPITLLNASRTALKIQSIDLDVFASGQRLGKAFWSAPQTINAGGQTKIFVRCSLGLSSVVNAAASIYGELKGRKISLRLEGDVMAEGFTVPVDATTQLTIPFSL